MNNNIGKNIGKVISFTVLPFGIPLIFNVIPTSLINDIGKIVIVLLLFAIDTYFVIKITIRDNKELNKAKEIIDTNKKYYISRKVLNRLANCEKIKCGFIQEETYKVHYNYKENILLYNSHRYLERVCDELKTLISDITHIDLEYVSVSFIYKYPKLQFEDVADREYEKWDGWKWITGKDSTTGFDLKELIARKDSYYHYLVANDKTTSFENDKAKLINQQCYYVGEKDRRHKEYGSISAHTMSFRNNNCTFCTSYLIISTYGKKFYDYNGQNEFKSETEFSDILFEQIIPPFRKLIETELGLLYLRHNERTKMENDSSILVGGKNTEH